jgi:hypothetical protein
MKYPVLLFSLMILSLSMSAQEGTIEGKVYAIDSISPLAGVHVFIQGTRHGAVSNGNGFFSIGQVPSGNHTVVASSIGYVAISQIVDVPENQTISTDFFIDEAISSLNEVVVMTKGNTGLKDIPGSVSYI